MRTRHTSFNGSLMSGGGGGVDGGGQKSPKPLPPHANRIYAAAVADKRLTPPP